VLVAMQLKGMAVEDFLANHVAMARSSFTAGAALATERNAEIVWARARDSSHLVFTRSAVSVRCW
jgi:hypothetical protein